MNPENSEVRGWILTIIERMKPYGASFELIEASLCDLEFPCSINEIKAHLKYLEGKGYIRTDEIKRQGVIRRINYLTPKGVDLKEGNIPEDPGVMLVG